MLSFQVRLLSKWQLKMVFPFRILGAKVLPRLNGILVSLFRKCQGESTNYESSWAARVFQWNKLTLIVLLVPLVHNINTLKTYKIV